MILHETLIGARPLRLSVPDSHAPAAGWPLLVLLDGDWAWPLTPPPPELDRCAVLLPGHGPDAQARARRTLDYTPPSPKGMHWPDPRHPEWKNGGAPAFLDELLGPCLQWARRYAAIDATRSSLYGHSYGGLFTLHTLLHRPDAFTRIICASPSLWWRDGFVARELEGLRAHPPTQPVRLIVMAGSAERRYPRPASHEAPDRRAGGVPTLPATRALVARLQGIPNLQARLVVLPGLSHGPMLHAAARQAVVLTGRDLP